MKRIIQAIFLVLFYASAVAQGDLTIMGGVSSDASYPIHVGITQTITFNVKNIGTAVMGPTQTGISVRYANTTDVPILIKKISMEALSAGGGSNIQVSFPIPYSIKADGDYEIIVELNYGEISPETDHLNNRSSTILHIASSPWAAQNLPYPIIFVHGYMSDSSCFHNFIDFLKAQYGFSYGGNMDFCLNADRDLTKSNIATDYHDFILEDGHKLNEEPGDLYTVNFKVNPDGQSPYNNIWESNQAAIVKQGRAIQDAITHVLAKTGKDKVILVCHSMGGLAAREYLQNPTLFQTDKKKHVAKICTIGTPHGGTLIRAVDLHGIWDGYDGTSEAIRDLRTAYITGYSGAYLFGGAEDKNYMYDEDFGSFNNLDVNCNGQSGDIIIGINHKPIPTDITYSCLVGTGYALPINGDGVVTEYSANLNNFLPVKATVFYVPYNNESIWPWHLNLPDQFDAIMQGIDEPSNDFIPGHAYNITTGQLYYGNITYQSVTSPPIDYDSYMISAPSNRNLNIQVFNIPTSVFSITVFNSSNVSIASFPSNGKGYLNVDVPVTAGNYYVVLSGVPTAESYLYPYAFKCTLNEVTSYCGGTSTLTAASGTFSDGSGSSNYGNNSDCMWKIQPSGGKTITLNFSAFNVSNRGDTLFVYDGGTTSSALLGKFTGNSLPPNIASSGGTMLVRFVTDAAKTAAGWNANYTAVTNTVYCSGTTMLTESSGTFSDGSASNNYGNNSHCGWLIAPAGAYSITLNFLTFNTELNNDLVNIYDGANNNAPLLALFSGKAIPAHVTSSGGTMFVEFTTNATTAASGWSASYTSYVPFTNSGIVKYETWFDTSYKTRTSTTIMPQVNFQLNTTIPTTNLIAGLHSFHVRFMDNSNRLSSVISQFFVKLPSTVSINTVTGYEYWFDNNYNSRKISTTAGQQAYQLFDSVNVTNLAKGLHAFHIRFKDAGNTWSAVVTQFFINSPGSKTNKIALYEYWFDNNYARKISNPIADNQTYQLLTGLSTTGLLQGLHSFHTRFRDSSGVWSSVVSQFFIYTPTAASGKINAYEYWFDNNYPGKTSTAIAPQATLQLNTAINAGTLKQGLHSFHARFRDSLGGWSSVISQFFFYAPAASNVNITKYEYWFDNKYGQKITQVISPSESIYALNTSVPATSLSTGKHTFNIRFMQDNNLWSSVISQSFNKGADFVKPSLALSVDSLKFTDSEPVFIYPNPGSGIFYLGFEKNTTVQSIYVYNSNGQLVYKTGKIGAVFTWQIDLHKEAQGVYFVNIFEVTKKYTKKIIIAR